HSLDAKQRALATVHADPLDLDAGLTAHEAALNAARHDVAQRSREERRARSALGDANRRVASARRDLASARLLASRTTAGVDTVRTCVDGVAGATIQSRAGDSRDAVASLRRVQD